MHTYYFSQLQTATGYKPTKKHTQICIHAFMKKSISMHFDMDFNFVAAWFVFVFFFLEFKEQIANQDKTKRLKAKRFSQ